MASLDLTSKKNSLKATIPGLSLGIVAFLFLFLTYKNQPQELKLAKDLIAPPKGLHHVAFGYQEVMADLLWIRSIQDFDYCDRPINKQVCTGNSWLYKMLDVTTDLSPKFRIPYAAGSLALSVIISDVAGATKIFEKGVAALPHDWTIAYRAAYHYLYEENNKKRAAELLIQASKAGGGPYWLSGLAGRLYSEAGHLDLAKSLLQDMIASKQDENLIRRLQDKIASIEKSSQ